MNAARLPACIAALLFPFAACAQTAPAPAPAQQPEPAPFQGLGTLAATPTPTPAATPTPTPAVVYEKPDVNFSIKKTPKVNGVIFRLPTAASGPEGPQSTPRPLLAAEDNTTPPFTLQGTIRSFHPPADGYRVECFFLVKIDTGKPFIFGARPYFADGSGYKLSFASPSEARGGFLYALPEARPKSAGPPASTHATDPTAVKLTGDVLGGRPVASPQPVSGWIMRIYAGDQLVCIAASEDTNSRIAQDNPGYFDKVFAIFNP